MSQIAELACMGEGLFEGGVLKSSSYRMGAYLRGPL